MIEKGRISSRQGSMLMLSAMIGSIFLFIPRFALETTGSDGSIALTLAFMLTLVYLIILLRFLSFFPEQNIYEITKTALGKYLGSLINLIFIAGAIFYAAVVVRSMGEFFITLILPETPLSVFIIAMLILATLAAASGIEALARLNEFWLPLILISFVLIFLGTLSEFEIFRLRPLILSRDIPNLPEATLKLANIYLQFGIVIFIFPYIKDKSCIKRDAIISTVLAWFFLVAIVLITAGFFGKDLTRYFVWPTLELTRNIRVAYFFERMEALFVVIWLLMAFIKISIFVYAASLGVRHTFRIKTQSWVPFVLAAPIYYVSFIPDNMPEVLEWIKMWELHGLVAFFGVAMPMVIFLVAKIRGKGAKTGAKKNSNSVND